MLKELYIKNYALIDELTIHFSRNLTVLSGETGAGKSIIVGAMGLILGEKAKTSLIRSGRETCIVEGRIEADKQHPVFEILRSKGIAYGGNGDNEDIVIRRIITTTGTSKSFVNGLQVTVRDLQEITGILVDIHGQHEHQSLLNVKNHGFLLDRYGKLQDDLAAYRRSYRKAVALKEEIDRRKIDEREKERRVDILKYSINEIAKAKIGEGEEEELEKEYKVLKNYEELVSAVTGAYNYLKLHESSALSMVEGALSDLSKIKDYSSEVEAILNELDTTRIVIEDSAYNLQSFVDGIEYEPGKIDRILSRIEHIKSLKKKYGDTVKDIVGYKEKCEEELQNLVSNEEIIRGLETQLDSEMRSVQKYAIELSARRRVAARTLKESIVKELSFLNLGKAQFAVNICYKENPEGDVTIDGKKYELTASGLDHVEFMISTNVGEPLLPLKNVASGGELSRIMLAIKTVLGNVDPILTFVFDEIDAGIGGRVSWAVGNRLKELSRLKQILCITHQAQIASKGNINIRVDKVNREGRAVTEVSTLDWREKVEEIARMISGKKISEAALRQAREMICEQ